MDLTAFRFKTLPPREFLVREQAIEENLYTSFTLFYSHFQRHNRLSALAEALAAAAPAASSKSRFHLQSTPSAGTTFSLSELRRTVDARAFQVTKAVRSK
jgi:hypothetical protein